MQWSDDEGVLYSPSCAQLVAYNVQLVAYNVQSAHLLPPFVFSFLSLTFWILDQRKGGGHCDSRLSLHALHDVSVVVLHCVHKITAHIPYHVKQWGLDKWAPVADTMRCSGVILCPVQQEANMPV